MTATGQNNTQHARRVPGSRIASITGLVTTRQHLTSLQEELNDTERSGTQACARARTDGWSGDKLRRPGPGNASATERRTDGPTTGTHTTPAEQRS